MLRSTSIAFVGFLLCALLLQWRGGAFAAEFGGNADEAAHYVTSLMVRDYVASGMTLGPYKFAEDYYTHYPKVAFGIWPPLFHLGQAAWMLVVSPSRDSVLVLMALYGAAFATLLFIAAKSEFGTPVAICLGILLVSVPKVQVSTSSIMPDLMMSCFILAATLFYGRYLEHQRTRDGLIFGILAAVAILVKYNALALALVPLFALLLNRQFDQLRRPSFWLPAGVVAIICAPWYLFNRTMVQYAMEPVPGIADIPGAMRANLASLAMLLGIPLFVIALVGLVSRLSSRSSQLPSNGKWTAAASLLLALWFFHSVLYPVNDNRYLLAGAPVLLLFVAAGSEEITRWLSSRMRIRYLSSLAGIVVIALIYAAGAFRIPEKKHYGWSELATALTRRFGDSAHFVLVSGPPTSEGMLVSEMALLDRPRHHFILRASKVLASSTWMLEHYQLRYSGVTEMARFLKETPISMIVIDRSAGYQSPHHALLQETLALQAAEWVPINMGNPANMQLFQRRAPAPQSEKVTISVDLGRTIGRHVVIHESLPAAQ